MRRLTNVMCHNYPSIPCWLKTLCWFSMLIETPDSAYAQLQLVCQLQLFQDLSNLASITHALITSCSDCYSVRYMGLLLKKIQKMYYS